MLKNHGAVVSDLIKLCDELKASGKLSPALSLPEIMNCASHLASTHTLSFHWTTTWTRERAADGPHTTVLNIKSTKNNSDSILITLHHSKFQSSNYDVKLFEKIAELMWPSTKAVSYASSYNTAVRKNFINVSKYNVVDVSVVSNLNTGDTFTLEYFDEDVIKKYINDCVECQAFKSGKKAKKKKVNSFKSKLFIMQMLDEIENNENRFKLRLAYTTVTKENISKFVFDGSLLSVSLVSTSDIPLVFSFKLSEKNCAKLTKEDISELIKSAIQTSTNISNCKNKISGLRVSLKV